MAKALSFTGKYDELKESLESVLFCGPDGGPLTVEAINVGEDKDGNAQVEFVVLASSVKKVIGGEVEPIESLQLSTVVGLKGDRQITFNVLSDAFGLTGEKERLKDDGADWLRLAAADHPESLVDRIVGKPSKSLYFRAKVQAADDGGVKGVYFNPTSPPLRTAAKDNKLADLRKRFNIGN